MTTLTVNGNTNEIIILSTSVYTTRNILSGSTVNPTNFSWPLTISNSGTSSLKVLFNYGITLTGITHRIICGSNNIQIGDTSVENLMTTINISNVSNYPGLVSSNNRNNIYVFNVDINVINSTLSNGGGWIGISGFGSGTTSSTINTYIVNCYSNGPIPQSGGGIVGSQAARGSNATDSNRLLKIIGCASSGTIGTGGGGIVGSNCGKVSCEECWSLGTIGSTSGGIYGSNALSSLSSFSVSATNCYSAGEILTNGGGIYGLNAAAPLGSIAYATTCYSTGSTGESGICGGTTYTDASGTTKIIVENCYAIGTTRLAPTGTNVITVTVNNSYSSLSWTEVDAIAALTGIPDESNVGSVWIRTGSGIPFKLKNMGVSPYTYSNIVLSNNVPSPVRTHSESIYPIDSNSTNVARVTGQFALVNPTSEISLDADTGSISTYLNIISGGVYNLVIINTGITWVSGYSVTSYQLTVTATTITGSDTLLINDSQYSFDAGTTWIDLIWPVTIVNNGSEHLVVNFVTDITFTKTYQYFICGSDNIQFGPSSLNETDGKMVIVVSNVSGYSGLIRNGTEDTNGYNGIRIYNLQISSSTSTLNQQNGTGWIGHSYFSRGSNSYIVNCSSDGPIGDGAGGIVGSHALSNSNDNYLYIIGCYSKGSIGAEAGGIVGPYSLSSLDVSSTIYCIGSWSSGSIAPSGGGIYGAYAANSVSASASASDCYSTGELSLGSGGIYGNSITEGTATAQNCYSTGIGIFVDGVYQSGGIYGDNTNNSTASNCYADINIILSGSNNAVVNCYAVPIDGWSTVDATAALSTEPIWYSNNNDEPFKLLTIGYSPYTNNIIQHDVNGVPSLVKTYQFVAYNDELLPSSNFIGSYSIISVNNTGTFTIDTDARITAQVENTAILYQIKIRNDRTGTGDGYLISTFNLIIKAILDGPDLTSVFATTTENRLYPRYDDFVYIKWNDVRSKWVLDIEGNNRYLSIRVIPGNTPYLLSVYNEADLYGDDTTLDPVVISYNFCHNDIYTGIVNATSTNLHTFEGQNILVASAEKRYRLKFVQPMNGTTDIWNFFEVSDVTSPVCYRGDSWVIVLERKRGVMVPPRGKAMGEEVPQVQICH